MLKILVICFLIAYHLLELPDITIWDKSNVTKMDNMFN